MEKRLLTSFLVVFCAITLPTAGQARPALAVRPGGLTADECARRALQVAPALAAARADIAEQEAATLSVMSDYIPDLTREAS